MLIIPAMVDSPQPIASRVNLPQANNTRNQFFLLETGTCCFVWQPPADRRRVCWVPRQRHRGQGGLRACVSGPFHGGGCSRQEARRLRSAGPPEFPQGGSGTYCCLGRTTLWVAALRWLIHAHLGAKNNSIVFVVSLWIAPFLWVHPRPE